MKAFKDLEFRPHPGGPGVRAVMTFPNGYGISVIQTPYSYTNGPDEYEAGVLKNGSLTYDTPITDDVEGYLTENAVTLMMEKIQALQEEPKPCAKQE